MLSLEQCRQIEPDLEKVSDEEVTRIRNLLYGLGQLAYETWDNDRVDEKNDSKSPLGLLTPQPEVE